jgi:hypothetical protein
MAALFYFTVLPGKGEVRRTFKVRRTWAPTWAAKRGCIFLHTISVYSIGKEIENHEA